MRFTSCPGMDFLGDVFRQEVLVTVVVSLTSILMAVAVDKSSSDCWWPLVVVRVLTLLLLIAAAVVMAMLVSSSDSCCWDTSFEVLVLLFCLREERFLGRLSGNCAERSTGKLNRNRTEKKLAKKEKDINYVNRNIKKGV